MSCTCTCLGKAAATYAPWAHGFKILRRLRRTQGDTKFIGCLRKTHDLASKVIETRLQRRSRCWHKDTSGRKPAWITHWEQTDDWIRWRSTCMQRQKHTCDKRWDTVRARLHGMQRWDLTNSKKTRRVSHQKEWDGSFRGAGDRTSINKRWNTDYTRFHRPPDERRVLLQRSDLSWKRRIGATPWPQRISSLNIENLRLPTKRCAVTQRTQSPCEALCSSSWTSSWATHVRKYAKRSFWPQLTHNLDQTVRICVACPHNRDRLKQKPHLQKFSKNCNAELATVHLKFISMELIATKPQNKTGNSFFILATKHYFYSHKSSPYVKDDGYAYSDRVSRSVERTIRDTRVSPSGKRPWITE